MIRGKEGMGVLRMKVVGQGQLLAANNQMIGFVGKIGRTDAEEKKL